MTIDDDVKRALTEQTECRLVPMYEGNNVCAWIGFKHINYLVEQAILQHCKVFGLSSRHLYEAFGVGIDVVDIDTRILNSVHLDDDLTATVSPKDPGAEGEWKFRVVLSADGQVKDVTSTVRVALRRDTYIDDTDQVPDVLRPFVVDAIENTPPASLARPMPTGAAAPDTFVNSLIADANGVGWVTRIGYPMCHYNERMAMSGYLRLLEEAKDRFVAARGISVKTLLDENRWIPAVPHSRIVMLAEARMEEDLHVCYAVDEVFKDLTYKSRFDAYVLRDGLPVHTATGTIIHGYAKIHRRDDWSLVNFDDRVLTALAAT